MKVFKKNCPECGIEQKYSTPQNYYKALKRNRQCRKCMYKSPEYRKKHQLNSTEMWRDENHLIQMEKIHNSEKWKRKRREITQNTMRSKFGSGNLATVNKNACQVIDEIGEKFGYKFQHGLNGGEVSVCGYSLDGYDKEKNVVFEYDEPRHYDCDNNLKEEDLIRQKNIIEEMKPVQFLRYNERLGKLIDVISEKEVL